MDLHQREVRWVWSRRGRDPLRRRSGLVRWQDLTLFTPPPLAVLDRPGRSFLSRPRVSRYRSPHCPGGLKL
jgi:hypothetical protein